MNCFVKICILYSILQNVESKALAGVKRTFQFDLVPFKHLSVFLEHVPFGKFELKHSLEKRDTIDELIPNEIPGGVDKKVMLTSVVAPAVEVAPPPVPVPVPAPAPVPAPVPFVIELAPKEEVPVVPEPVHQEPVPVAPVVPKVPIMYTDISQLPLFNFGFPKPIPIEVPYPIHIEVPVKPEPIVAPAVPVEPVPAVPVEPVPVVPVEPVPVPVFTEPPPVAEVPVVTEVKPVAPPLPNYVIKGSRLILFFGSKILQMISQFVDGKSFAEFTFPPLPALAKKK